MTDNIQALWECQNQFNPRYHAKVVRIGPDKGMLIISYDGYTFYAVNVDVNNEENEAVSPEDIDEWSRLAGAITQRARVDYGMDVRL